MIGEGKKQLSFKDSLASTSLTPPKELTLSITPQCNLTCEHCWPECSPNGKSSPVPVEYLRHVISQWHDAGLTAVCLTGGEPFTHPHWQEVLLSCCQLPGFESVTLQTNGTLFNEETINLLLQPEYQKTFLQISLDGSRPETHDRIRGIGSFSRTISGLQLLSERGLASRTTIAFTETAENFTQLPELLQLAAHLGVTRLISGTLIMGGRAERNDHLMVPTPKQYTDLIATFENDEEFKSLYLQKGVISAIEWYRNRNKPGNPGNCSCIASPYITAEGRLYPCTLLPLEQFAIDENWTRPLHSILAEIQQRWPQLNDLSRKRPSTIPECQSCDGRDHCQSGCLGRSLPQTGDFFLPEDRCLHRKSVYAWKK